MNTPIKYKGGKHFARRHIYAAMPPHAAYVEPFVGGGSVFFGKPRTGYDWLNDLNADLINMYTVLRDAPEAIADRVQSLPNTRANFYYMRDEAPTDTPHERAARTFWLQKVSFSGNGQTWARGKLFKEGLIWGTHDDSDVPPDIAARRRAMLFAASHHLQGVRLTSLDFEQVIDTAPTGAWLFLDPPYHTLGNDFYKHNFTPADHERLAACLRRNTPRLSWLLTYDDASEVRDLYGWATVREVERQRCTAIVRGGEYKRRTELFISNCAPPGQLALLEEAA